MSVDIDKFVGVKQVQADIGQSPRLGTDLSGSLVINVVLIIVQAFLILEGIPGKFLDQ
jgi:hypothetical protein